MLARFPRALMALICLIALTAGLISQPPIARADVGYNWTGAYYANSYLQGNPVFYRIDPAVVFNWGTNSPGPGIGSQQWSARWSTVQYLNAGMYRFVVTVDDGARMYIDGQLIIDAWRDQAATTYTVNVPIVAGNHAFQVDYYQSVGDASIAVSWAYVQTVSTAWTAQYFNNPYLAGPPSVVRYEPSINYNWGHGSPDPAIQSQNFSARWTATLPFNGATYRFTLAGDDGVRLFIDDLPIIDQWHDQVLTAYTIDFTLSAGLHTMRVEYYQHTDQAVVNFNYQIAIGPPPYVGSQSSFWYGEYYANPNLQGAPLFVRLDGQSGINFDWSVNSPVGGFPHDYYSVRWTRQVCVPGRPYVFYLTVDDGARFYIDSTLIIDSWRVQYRTSYSQYVTLTAGCHVFRLEYFQATGDADIGLTWSPPDGQNPPQYIGGPPVTPPTGTQAIVQYASVLNVRSGPSIAYDILTRVVYGNVLNLLACNADCSWIRVITPDNTYGWVNASYIQPTQGNIYALPKPAVPPPPIVETGTRGRLSVDLRVRSGPSTLYDQIDTLPFDSIVDIVGRNADSSWLQVSYGNTVGWIYSPYVFIVSGYLSNVPITG